MHQLIETVLAIRAWLAENNWSSVDTVSQSSSSLATRLTIALHIKLLDVGWEAQKCLAVR